MRVIVRAFLPGYATGICSEQWYVVKLKNGLEIEVFDTERNDLRDYIGKEVEMLIIIAFFEDINKLTGNFPYVYGNIIKNYSIPSKWLEYENNLDLNRWMGVKTKDGIFLVWPNKSFKTYYENFIDTIKKNRENEQHIPFYVTKHYNNDKNLPYKILPYKILRYKINKLDLENEQHIPFYVTRFHLLSWHPIEEKEMNLV